MRRVVSREGEVLDLIFALEDLQAVGVTAQVHASAVATAFTAHAAGAELIRHRRRRFDCEFNGLAVAGPF